MAYPNTYVAAMSQHVVARCFVHTQLSDISLLLSGTEALIGTSIVLLCTTVFTASFFNLCTCRDCAIVQFLTVWLSLFVM